MHALYGFPYCLYRQNFVLSDPPVIYESYESVNNRVTTLSRLEPSEKIDIVLLPKSISDLLYRDEDGEFSHKV